MHVTADYDGSAFDHPQIALPQPDAVLVRKIDPAFQLLCERDAVGGVGDGFGLHGGPPRAPSPWSPRRHCCGPLLERDEINLNQGIPDAD